MIFRAPPFPRSASLLGMTINIVNGSILRSCNKLPTWLSLNKSMLLIYISLDAHILRSQNRPLWSRCHFRPSELHQRHCAFPLLHGKASAIPAKLASAHISTSGASFSRSASGNLPPADTLFYRFSILTNTSFLRGSHKTSS